MAKAAAASACIPLRDLPIIRTQGPAKYLEDYCVPLALLHFYHPDVWRMHDTLRAPDATNTPGAGPREPARGRWPRAWLKIFSTKKIL